MTFPCIGDKISKSIWPAGSAHPRHLHRSGKRPWAPGQAKVNTESGGGWLIGPARLGGCCLAPPLERLTAEATGNFMSSLHLPRSSWSQRSTSGEHTYIEPSCSHAAETHPHVIFSRMVREALRLSPLHTQGNGGRRMLSNLFKSCCWAVAVLGFEPRTCACLCDAPQPSLRRSANTWQPLLCARPVLRAQR